jgi:hypothetical protein
VKRVVVSGPPALFPQLLGVEGLNMDHGQAGEGPGGSHVLAMDATDEAIVEMEALGLTVDVKATEADRNALLAQVVQEGGSDVTDIDIA